MSVVKLSADEIASQLCVFLRDNVLAPQIEVTSDTEPIRDRRGLFFLDGISVVY